MLLCMSLSFGEIFVIFVVGVIFFKPNEIMEFLKKAFSVKKTLEKDIQKLTDEIQDTKNTTEFFEVTPKCQKQQ